MVVLVFFIFALGYAVLRYVGVGPVDAGHIPLYVVNKAMAFTAEPIQREEPDSWIRRVMRMAHLASRCLLHTARRRYSCARDAVPWVTADSSSRRHSTIDSSVGRELGSLDLHN